MAAAAAEGGEVMVKPPGWGMPGTYVSSHWPGRNYKNKIVVFKKNREILMGGEWLGGPQFTFNGFERCKRMRRTWVLTWSIRLSVTACKS